jgi:hypothetical protein
MQLLTKSLIKLFGTFALVGVLLSCSSVTHGPNHPDHAFSALAQAEIPFEVAPPSSGATLADLAFSLPVWEITATGAKQAVDAGDLQIKSSATSWVAYGDGAQPTITLELLKPDSSFQGPYHLTVGPRWSGLPGGPTYTFVYDLERHSDHWYRISYRRIITKTGKYSANQGRMRRKASER